MGKTSPKFIWKVQVPTPGLAYPIPVGPQDPTGPYWEHWGWFSTLWKDPKHLGGFIPLQN